MIRALIVDDEDKLREVIAIKLRKLHPGVEVIGEAGSSAEALHLIQTLRPDLVFLDITMPRESGIDLLRKLKNVDFEVIFITGHSEYGVDAVKLNAADYLLKPIRNAELKHAVDKVIRKIEDKQKLADYDKLRQSIPSVRRISVPGTHYVDQVDVDDVIRCEGWQKYTRIHLRDRNPLISSYNLGVFRRMLADYGFYEVHKSHLINKKHITRYLTEGIVIMSDGSRVPVARRKRHEFTNGLNMPD